MSWVAKVSRNKEGEEVLLIDYTYPDGRQAYFVLKFLPEKIDELEGKMARSEAVDLEEYGIVVDSGFGPMPEHYASAFNQ